MAFANGMVVRERIVDIDDARRRVAYGVVGGRFDHHSASMQIVPEGEDCCRVSDFLPDEVDAVMRPLVEQGTEAFRRAAETW